MLVPYLVGLWGGLGRKCISLEFKAFVIEADHDKL